jgi:hypothetical protein
LRYYQVKRQKKKDKRKNGTDMKINNFFLWLLCAAFFVIVDTPVFGQNNNDDAEFNIKQLSNVERWELFRQHKNALKIALQQDERHDELKETIIEGNQIRILITNQGSISTPDADNSNSDLVWPRGPSGLGYAFEFGPLVGAEVIDARGDTVHIVSDGFFSGSGGEFKPGTTERWGWEPKPGFADPGSPEVATFSDLDSDEDGKPDSWPENWYNESLGRYIWPAFLGDDATTPDEEVYYIMDDLDNAEFEYYPFPEDSSRRGLGLELQVRIFQFNNPLAEDIIFLVYTITNVSPKRLDNVYLGMFGDPHVGGPNDYSDDNGGFISAFDESFPFNTRNMLFAWDNDGVGDGGKRPGYFGYRFLESPGISTDNQDNDNDELIDESQTNDAGILIFGPIGIYGDPKLHWSGDEDGDWVEEFDDVGIDGIPNTGDTGEGDGKPSQLFYLDLNANSIFDPGEPSSSTREPGMRFWAGEPNFGFLDIAESDQLGLTSFNALLYGGNNEPRNDKLMWDKISTPNQKPGDPPPTIEQTADNVFIYGSGSFSLEPGESQRFSIALLMALDFDDLLNNAQISQQVFESDYRFAQAPDKPKLVVVTGDNKVTLYWDTGAETSFDPFVARANPDDQQKGFDFEGYRIYRSQDFSFNDTQTITDSKGVPFLSRPWKMINGLPAQFDLDNEYEGLSDIEYAGRGVRYDLGRNTGLVHSFVDSNNVKNGVTYFYAVTSYDHGDVNAQLAPTESQRVIQRNAVNRLFSFDLNTAMAVPGPPAGGFVTPSLANSDDNQASREAGIATGAIGVEFIDPLLVKDDTKYEINFLEIEVDSVTTGMAYDVINLSEQTSMFVSRDTLFANIISGVQLVENSVVITDLNDSVVDTSRYIIDAVNGRVKGAYHNALPEGESFRAVFLIKPVVESTSLNGEDDNAVFDGIKMFVSADEVGLDPLSTDGGRSGFRVIETNTNFSDIYTEIDLASVGKPNAYPSDFEIQFANYDTTAEGDFISPVDTSILTNVKTNFKVIDAITSEQIDFFILEPAATRNGRWDYQESIILIKPQYEQPTETTYEVKFSPPYEIFESSSGQDSVVVDDPIYPGAGDKFLFFSTKPFVSGDKYSFTTKASVFNNEIAKSVLDKVIVVPNPYFSFSDAELAGIRTDTRDDRRIEFRNLPQQCTIRIYTIVGELVRTIEKNDPTSYAVWDLLSFESQEIAYGVYIYHIDAPGVGVKIGRLAVIK